MSDRVSRRDLFKLAGVAGVASVVPGATQAQAPDELAEPNQQSAQSAGESDTVLFFFNDEEEQFITAAIDRLIPQDPQFGGAVEAGVLYYIDRQLASAYGGGARMYLNGPWKAAAPPQFGYQLRQSPAELYRIGIEECRAYVRETSNGQEFWDLSGAAQDRVLTAIETGQAQLASVPGPVFFETLLANTIEGFFADPAYGGNRGMIGWKMVGFPGAYAAYREVVDQHGFHYTHGPISFANEDARQAHLHMDDHH